MIKNNVPPHGAQTESSSENNLSLRDLLIPGETEQQFLQIVNGIKNTLKPEDFLTERLAYELALDFLRLNRIHKAETLLHKQPVTNPEGKPWPAYANPLSFQDMFTTLHKFESNVKRDMFKPIQSLKSSVSCEQKKEEV